jgi:hypothetical protein
MDILQRLARIEEIVKPLSDTQTKHSQKIESIEKLVWRVSGGFTVVIAIASYFLKG